MPSNHLPNTEQNKTKKKIWEVDQKHDVKELPPQNVPESPACMEGSREEQWAVAAAVAHNLPRQTEVARLFGLISKATSKKGKGRESKQQPH